jgi:hypothetical protein
MYPAAARHRFQCLDDAFGNGFRQPRIKVNLIDPAQRKVDRNRRPLAVIAPDLMLFDNWFDPAEDGVRERVRGFIEMMLGEELEVASPRPRYGPRKPGDNCAPSSGVGTGIASV